MDIFKNKNKNNSMYNNKNIFNDYFYITDDNKTKNNLKLLQKRNFSKRLNASKNFRKELTHKNLSVVTLLSRNFFYYRDKLMNEIDNKNEKSKNENCKIENSDKKLENQVNDKSDNNDNNFMSHKDNDNDNHKKVRRFLNQSVSKNVGFKILKKRLKPIQLKQNEKIKKIIENNVFTMKKRKLFEKEVFNLSLYDYFNYKENNLQSIYSNNQNLNDYMFPNLKKISNLNKPLIKDDKRNTNGNFLYKDYENEKKETILKVTTDDNSVLLLKKNLTRKKKLDVDRDADYANESTQLGDENNYLKKLIIKNKIKNKSQNDINFFDTYDQRNKKILIGINNNFKNKKNKKSIHEDLKVINQKYAVLFKKRKVNNLSNKMKKISIKINDISKQLNSFINSTNNIFNKDITCLYN